MISFIFRQECNRRANQVAFRCKQICDEMVIGVADSDENCSSRCWQLGDVPGDGDFDGYMKGSRVYGMFNGLID